MDYTTNIIYAGSDINEIYEASSMNSMEWDMDDTELDRGYKVVLVGSGEVGKTFMILTFTELLERDAFTNRAFEMLNGTVGSQSNAEPQALTIDDLIPSPPPTKKTRKSKAKLKSKQHNRRSQQHIPNTRMQKGAQRMSHRFR